MKTAIKQLYNIAKKEIKDRNKIGFKIFHCLPAKNLDSNDAEEHEKSPAEDTQKSEVVGEELNVRPYKRSKVSCLHMQVQKKQHTMDMEILQLKKNNLIEKHQKRMEVLEVELEYWTSAK